MPRIITLSQDTPQARPDSIDAEWTLQSNIEQKRFSFSIFVIADNPLQTEDDIKATPGIPKIGERVRGTGIRSVKAKEIDTAALLWEVTIECSSVIGTLQGENQPSNPDEIPSTWEWGGEEEDKLVEIDAIAAVPIQNSAREPILLTGPVPITTLTITRYRTSFDTSNANQAFACRVNLTPFWNWPAGTALMTPIRDEGATMLGIPCRKLTFTIKFLMYEIPSDPKVIMAEELAAILEGGSATITGPPGGTITGYSNIPKLSERNPSGRPTAGWITLVLDHGTRYKKIQANVSDPAIYVPFKDKEQKDTEGNLDGFGGDLSVHGAGSKPVYIGYNRFLKVDFNQLQIGPFV